MALFWEINISHFGKRGLGKPVEKNRREKKRREERKRKKVKITGMELYGISWNYLDFYGLV